jgi:predicted TIM-barrel fold metal-dependent hydrolase
MVIVDSHVHIFPKEIRRVREKFFPGEPAFELLYKARNARLAGGDELIEEMDRGGVEKSVVFGFPWEGEETFQRHNDYILESVSRYPDRLLGLACFSLFADRCVDEASRCLNAGLSGIGELAVYKGRFSIESIPSLDPVMSVCLEKNAPLLVHTNEPVGHSYPGKAPMTLSEVYEFLKAYPQNRIILAHWGGGIFFYGLLKKEVKEVLKNTWFDTAASPFLYKPEIFRMAGKIIGFEKILLGSDYPLIKPERYLKELRQLELAPDALNKISGENALSLFT